MSNINFAGWTRATGDLKPGEQAVFLDFLNLVKDGKAHLVYGADYRDGKPCLVNGVAPMISTQQVSPSLAFPAVVTSFDFLCFAMEENGLTETGLKGYVSPLMAEFLIRNFGEVKPMQYENTVTKAEVEAKPYVEPTDEEFMRGWLAAMAAPSPEAIVDADNQHAITEYTRSFVNVDRP